MIIKDITPDVIDGQGNFRILSAEYWKTTTAQERGLFGNRNAMYVLPTIELISRIKDLIGGRSAIEIGSGNGILAHSLGILATDNYQQAIPKYRRIYEAAGQPPIAYGKKVERISAIDAVNKYKPQVVVAAWVTHKFNALRPYAGGNEIGVEEEKIIDSVESYIFVGNTKVHEAKSIWNYRPYAIEYPDYVFSRAINGSRDFIAVWNRER